MFSCRKAIFIRFLGRPLLYSLSLTNGELIDMQTITARYHFKSNLIFFLILTVLGLNSKAVFSENYVDSLVNVINTSRNETHRLHAMVNLSRVLVTTNRDSTLALLNAAAKLATNPDPVLRARYYNSWGLYYWYNREFDKAIGMYNKVLELPETDGLLRHMAEALNNKGNLILRRGEVDSALMLFNESLRIDLKRDNLDGAAKTSNDLASLYTKQGQYELALRYLHDAVDHFERVGDDFKLTRAYNSMGIIYNSLNQADNAFKAYYQAVETAISPRDIDHIVTVYNNLFSSYLNQPNQFEKALQYAEKALEIAEERDDKNLLMVLNSNLSLYHNKVGNTSKSLHYSRLALAFAQLPEIRVYDLAGVYSHAGAIYHNLNMPDSARIFSMKALELSKVTKSTSLQISNHANLARIDSLQGDYFSALANFQKAKQLQDSTWRLENQNRIAELQIIYQTDKKEAENAALRESNLLKERVIKNQRLLMVYGAAAFLFFILFVFNLIRSKRKLRQVNSELRLMNAEIIAKQEEINRYNQELIVQKKELEDLNRTKDKFFSVIAHDLRGPFSGLINLLDLVLNEFDNMTEEEKKAMLATIYRSSENTYNLIVNLLEWSQAQRGTLKCVPMQSNIKSIVQDALAALSTRIDAKQHTVAVHISDTLSCFCDPDLTKSIFINLINNAIKFTPRNGLIEIYSESSNGVFTLNVRDNGVGIENEMTDSLFELGAENNRKGTEGELGTGLGLVMVKEFVEMQKGSLNVKSTVGEGTTFSFTLPTAE